MVELVGVLYEPGLLLLDGQLHLHHHRLLVEYVHQDVLVAAAESVLHPDDFKMLRMEFADSLDLFVQSYDFILFG